jgi:hypothetical protein
LDFRNDVCKKGARRVDIWRCVVVAAFVFSMALALLAQSENPAEKEQPKEGDESAAPVQPIPFSHKKHLALDLKCEFCHTNPDPGIDVSLPPTGQCMICHVSVAKNKPAIQKLAEYDKSKKPVPWLRVYAVPSWVYWNHRRHLDADVKCASCHGDVAQMETIKVTTKVTTMQGCVDCHQDKSAPVGCDTCHDNMGTQ